MTRTKSTYLALIAVLLSPMAANADPITVTNFSFEGPGCATGDGCIENPTLGNFTVGSVDGWAVSGGEAGVYRPTNVVFNAGFPTDGVQSGYANSGGTLEQGSLATIRGGETYTLTIDVGRRKDTCCTTLDFLISLTADGVDIGMVDETFFAGGIPEVGDWKTIVLSVVANASFDGQSLGIRLMAFGPQTNWDNVRLMDTATTVPEPGTLALLGLGLFGMGLARRRRKV